jgi:hypothetical protein
MSILCMLFGHSHGCHCVRCGKSINKHHWDGCKCTICGEIIHNWTIKDWSCDGYNYTFEKECTKCKIKTTVTERVAFDKIIFGKNNLITYKNIN